MPEVGSIVAVLDTRAPPAAFTAWLQDAGLRFLGHGVAWTAWRIAAFCAEGEKTRHFASVNELASRRRTVSDPTIEGTAGSAGFAGQRLAYRAVRIDVALFG